MVDSILYWFWSAEAVAGFEESPRSQKVLNPGLVGSQKGSGTGWGLDTRPVYIDFEKTSYFTDKTSFKKI